MQEDPNVSPSAEDIWGERHRRKSKLSKSTSFKFKGSKEIAKYAKSSGNKHTALLKIILETDSTKYPEGKVCFVHYTLHCRHTVVHLRVVPSARR